MATVKQFLKSKGTKVWSVPPTATTLESLKLMADKDIGALVVVDGETLVGIFSERDVARRLASPGGFDVNQPVKNFMVTSVYTVELSTTIIDCMRMMSAKHIRHLPVVDEGKVVALITIGDIVKQIIDIQESTIRGLENFIAGQSFEL